MRSLDLTPDLTPCLVGALEVAPFRAMAVAHLVPLLLIVGLAGCAGGPRSPVCSAQDALRAALGAVESAKAATASGDQTEVRRRMDEVEGHVSAGKTSLSGVDSDSGVGPAARAMLEAANYLEFMVGDFRATGTVDFTLTQFASRELNRATSGAGGAPLNC